MTARRCQIPELEAITAAVLGTREFEDLTSSMLAKIIHDLPELCGKGYVKKAVEEGARQRRNQRWKPDQKNQTCSKRA